MNARLLIPMVRLFALVVLITLTVLVFEPRAHAATATVTDCSAPKGAPGRLVNVINDAAAGDAVIFSCSGTITLPATITIDKDLGLDGTGQTITISGGNTVRVFIVNTGVSFKLQNLTVAHGEVSGSNGGGINNSGVLTVSNISFWDNSATGNGGGIYNSSTGTLEVANSRFSGGYAYYGGGIYNNSIATLNVTNSTFYDNNGGEGGGIHNSYGTLNVTNSTFYDNSGNGAGIYNTANGRLNVTNSTFFHNSAANWGGAIHNHDGTSDVTNSTFSSNSAYYGDNIYNSFGATMNLKNSIVATTSLGGNCSGTITNGGGNLQFGGMVANSCGAAIPTGDPNLSALANNGGPTLTMALGPGSAAIDTGDDSVCAAAPVNNLDQRGVSRPQGAHCDIGAFELQDGNSTRTSTPTRTNTPSNTPTATRTSTPTNTWTSTPTTSATITPTRTATSTATTTLTTTPTHTSTVASTRTNTPTVTRTPTNTATAIASPTLIPTFTPTATPTTGCTVIPKKPTLKAPDDGTRVSSSRPTLKWKRVPCASKYKVIVKNAVTGALLDNATMSAVVGVAIYKYQTDPLPRHTQIKWFVKACRAPFGCNKSSPRLFSTP